MSVAFETPPAVSPLRARDFVVAIGASPRHQGLQDWHVRLGGNPQLWTSRALDCRVWGPAPATVLRSADESGARHAACLLTGAPLAYGSVDADVIQRRLLAAYLSEGISALRQIEGSFCGVLVDEEARTVWVFTDRFGFRKAFTATTSTGTYAASRAVVLGRGLALDPDPSGAVCITMVGHTIGTRTLFAGCNAVRPATAVNVVNGSCCRYWDIRSFMAERRRGERDTRELRDRFNAACQSILESQAVAALNLTGGFDTRAVLSGALTARRQLTAITAGTVEKTSVDAIRRATGVVHHTLDLDPRSAVEKDHDFALLTDGEWDCTGGGALLRHWERLAPIAPSGCLHGGVGEVWRAYYYPSYWPSRSQIARVPVDFLAQRLIRPRLHLIRALAPAWRAVIHDIVRADVGALWNEVRTSDTLAAIDVFYLVERQRGLTRICSAADLWNPAYSPFAHSVFLEAGAGYLGDQNRGDRLHRDLITLNSRALAAVPRYPSGNCLPQTALGTRIEVLNATGHQLLGRALGSRLRQRVRGKSTPAYPYRLPTAGSISSLYDFSELGRMTESGPYGLGSIASVLAAFECAGSTSVGVR